MDTGPKKTVHTRKLIFLHQVDGDLGGRQGDGDGVYADNHQCCLQPIPPLASSQIPAFTWDMYVVIVDDHQRHFTHIRWSAWRWWWSVCGLPVHMQYCSLFLPFQNIVMETLHRYPYIRLMVIKAMVMECMLTTISGGDPPSLVTLHPSLKPSLYWRVLHIYWIECSNSKMYTLPPSSYFTELNCTNVRWKLAHFAL